jgi:hypothetical protein
MATTSKHLLKVTSPGDEAKRQVLEKRPAALCAGQVG